MSKYKFDFIADMPDCFCPYCGKPVGYAGRFFAWIFGTRFHDCDFSNVRKPTP